MHFTYVCLWVHCTARALHRAQSVDIADLDMSIQICQAHLSTLIIQLYLLITFTFRCATGTYSTYVTCCIKEACAQPLRERAHSHYSHAACLVGGAALSTLPCPWQTPRES